METLTQLVDGTRSGDLEAFGRLVRRFQQMAYGCAFSVLGDFHLAEDVAQEAFLEAYRQLPALREPEAFPGWFRRIVLKFCDRQTRRCRLPTVPLEDAAGVSSTEPGPDRAAEEREMKERVLDAIRSLPDGQRMVTTLFYIDGYSQNEISEFLEVPVTTVKKRLHDSRKKLKERMLDMVDETLKGFPLPGDFADVVVRKAASKEDLEGIKRILGPGYFGKRYPEYFEDVDAAAEENIYVVGEEGAVESAGYFDEITWAIGSTVLRAVRPREMAFEGTVPGEPDFVTFLKGYRGCFKLAAQQGFGLAIAHGSLYDHAFCGFVPSFYYPIVRLSCEKAEGVETPATVEAAGEAEAQEGQDALWQDPYATKMSAYIGGGVPHVVRQDGKVVGHVRVNRDFRPADHCDMPFGYVNDITVQTREAALAVIRLAGELARSAGDDEVWMMQSHRTRVTRAMVDLGGAYTLRPPCDLPGLDAEMVAIVDLGALAGALKDEFQSRLKASPAFHTEGAFSIAMQGVTVGFSVAGGKVEISNQKQGVHARLPRWAVTRLFMGYYAGEDLLEMGPIPCDRSDGKTPDDPELDMQELALPESESALFRALFPKLWPCATPDPDVWRWVIGEEGPHYQHEEAKTAEMKARIDALRFPWVGY